MKFSHDWLRQYVTIEEPPAAVGARLTAAGLPLDGLEPDPDAGARGDSVYDFDIFANRPDCMSHLGLAREYAALTGAPLRRPETAVAGGGRPTLEVASVTIDAPDLCARYATRCVLGVRVAHSPDWLRRRLESIGARPINNIVDITNFVLWELGQPLHAFDLEKLQGRRIIVRRARPGEILVTLDGVRRALAADMLVIADGSRPVALAGIMGGGDSEIGDGTRNILLESAWFDPVSVRRTARALGLRTDASHRFERGADPDGTVTALDRAARLIAETAGGAVTDPALDVRPRPAPPVIVTFRPARARTLLGLHPETAAVLPDAMMREALERRHFRVTAAGAAWEVTVPSFRRDIEREADLIEEVARHRGYDAVPSALPQTGDSAGGGRPPGDAALESLRASLLAAGYSEAMNYDMVEPEDCRLFGAEDPPVIENPLQSPASSLRSSLCPGLLRNVAHNLNHGLPGCFLFEIGTVFAARAAGRPEERRSIAWVAAGRGLPVHWSLPRRDADLFDARGALESFAERAGVTALAFSSDRIPWLAEGRAMRARRDGRPFGVFGEFDRRVLERYGIDRPVFGGEADLETLLAGGRPVRRFRPLPRTPAVRRDLALLVGAGVGFEAIETTIRAACPLPVSEIEAFDLYRGPGVPEGRTSLALQIVFQHPERTLTSTEVQAAMEAIVLALERTHDARMRGREGGANG